MDAWPDHEADQGNKTERCCAECGGVFEVDLSHASARVRRYCSVAHRKRALNRQTRRRRDGKQSGRVIFVRQHCLQCDQAFDDFTGGRRATCSQECADTYLRQRAWSRFEHSRAIRAGEIRPTVELVFRTPGRASSRVHRASKERPQEPLCGFAPHALARARLAGGRHGPEPWEARCQRCARIAA